MKDVKEIQFISCNEIVQYGPDEGQTNITPQMRARWKRVYNNIEITLKNCGININNNVKEDNSMIVTLKEPLSFENAIFLLKQLEEQYEIQQFQFDSEYDDWYDTNPHAEYYIFEKTNNLKIISLATYQKN